MSSAPCRLYLLTPPQIDLAHFPDVLAGTLSAGDVAALQIRMKDAEDAELKRTVDVLRPIAYAHDVALILNDRPDLATATGCDGVHVGQEDTPLADARKLMGDDAMIGVTCHNSRHLAMEAAEAGADYVAFGAFFETATKPPKYWATPDLVSWWVEMMEVPCVAIGGITVENCDPIVEAGADFLCVSGGVWNHADGPNTAVEQFIEAFRRHGRAPAL